MKRDKKYRLLSASFIVLLGASSVHASKSLNDDDDIGLITIAQAKKSCGVENTEQGNATNASLGLQDGEEKFTHNLSTVPPEILSHVFSFLDAKDIVPVAHVSHYTKAVALEHHHYVSRTVNDYVSFQTLYGSTIQGSDVEAHKKIASERNQITHLEISDKENKIGRIDLAHILKLTPRLRSIRVIDAELVVPGAMSDGSTSSRVSSLESLELSNCRIKPYAAHVNVTDALRATGAYVASLMINNAKHFSNLKIEGIPGFFTKHLLPSLKANERLKNVKDSTTNPFKAFKRLEILGDGYMTELPAEFSLFEHLKVLRLSGAHVQSVAPAKEGFEYFPNLEVLEVKNNKPQKRQEGIASLLKAAGSAASIRTITLENVGVSQLLSDNKDLLAPFGLLENFYSVGNPSLSALPKALYESKTLRRVVVQGSALQEFDSSFESPHIKHVDFSKNPALQASPTFVHPDAIEFLNFEGMRAQSDGWGAFFKHQWNRLLDALSA